MHTLCNRYEVFYLSTFEIRLVPDLPEAALGERRLGTVESVNAGFRPTPRPPLGEGKV